MASTGFTFATAGSSVDRGGSEPSWDNPGNVTANDDSYASTLWASGSSSDFLLGSAFGFAIPAGSTIDGVEVRYRRKIVFDGGSQNVTQDGVGLSNAGSPIGSPKTSLGGWEETETVVTKGSSSDTWGASLTPAIVNSATFGPRIDVTWDSGLGGLEHADVDSIEVNVHYTEPTGHIHLPMRGVG